MTDSPYVHRLALSPSSVPLGRWHFLASGFNPRRLLADAGPPTAPKPPTTQLST